MKNIKPIKLKVVNRGHGSRVVDSKTGKAISGVTDISFRHREGLAPVLQLEILGCELDCEVEFNSVDETIDDDGTVLNQVLSTEEIEDETDDNNSND